jgi:hypothetical protein
MYLKKSVKRGDHMKEPSLFNLECAYGNNKKKNSYYSDLIHSERPSLFFIIIIIHSKKDQFIQIRFDLSQVGCPDIKQVGMFQLV